MGRILRAKTGRAGWEGRGENQSSPSSLNNGERTRVTVDNATHLRDNNVLSRFVEIISFAETLFEQNNEIRIIKLTKYRTNNENLERG